MAIVDDSGHLLLLKRMDGTAPVTAEIAELKSRGAAISRRSTKVSEDRVGAVGVSGVQSHEDEQVCNAGIAALQ